MCYTERSQILYQGYNHPRCNKTREKKKGFNSYRSEIGNDCYLILFYIYIIITVQLRS